MNIILDIKGNWCAIFVGKYSLNRHSWSGIDKRMIQRTKSISALLAIKRKFLYISFLNMNNPCWRWLFICFLSFSSQLLLNIHLETHKEKPTEKEEICEYCAKRFSYKHGLQKHIQTVHLKKPQKPKEKVQCVVCGGWYAEKKYLERHMVIHSSEPVKCDLCETTLANKRSFDSHNRMFHKNGGLNFECHLCSKKFRIKSDLQVNCSTE